MLVLKPSQENTVVVTITEKAQSPSPAILFEFINEQSNENVRILGDDISMFVDRYNMFILDIGAMAQGYWSYTIYEGDDFSMYEASPYTLADINVTNLNVLEIGKVLVEISVGSPAITYQPTETTIVYHP